MFEPLAWTLIHMLWQVAVIALTVRFLLKLRFNRTASRAYAMCCCGLLAIGAAGLVTFWWEFTRGTALDPQPFYPASDSLIDTIEQTSLLWRVQAESYFPLLAMFWITVACVLIGRDVAGLTLFHLTNSKTSKRMPAPAGYAPLCQSLHVSPAPILKKKQPIQFSRDLRTLETGYSVSAQRSASTHTAANKSVARA